MRTPWWALALLGAGGALGGCHAKTGASPDAGTAFASTRTDAGVLWASELVRSDSVPKGQCLPNFPPGPGAAPLDLEWSGCDLSGFPVAPHFTVQRVDPERLPDSNRLCGDVLFDGSPLPACFPKFVSPDPPRWSFVICSHHLRGWHWAAGGHVNYFPVTVEGTVTFDDHSDDDDLDFSLAVDGNGGLTASNAPRTVPLEMSLHETLQRFEPPAWQPFLRALSEDHTFRTDLGHGDPSVAYPHVKRVFGPKRGQVLGLMGLDCEHGCKTELHPVYAMALTSEKDDLEPRGGTLRQRWWIVARNWGNEGMCSSKQHALSSALLPVMRLRLPRPQGSGALQAVDLSTLKPTPGADVTVTSDPEGVTLNLRLPDPDFRSGKLAFVGGTVQTDWSRP